MTTETIAGSTTKTQKPTFTDSHSDGVHSDWTDDNIIVMTSERRKKSAKKRWTRLANVRRANAAFRTRAKTSSSKTEFMRGASNRSSFRLSVTTNDGIMKWLGEGQLYPGSGSSSDEISDRESSDMESCGSNNGTNITRSRTVGAGRAKRGGRQLSTIDSLHSRSGTLRRSGRSGRSISHSPARRSKSPSKSPRSRSRNSLRKTTSVKLAKNVYKPVRRRSTSGLSLPPAPVVFRVALEERGTHYVEMTANTPLDTALERLVEKFHVDARDLRITANGVDVTATLQHHCEPGSWALSERTVGALATPIIILEGSATLESGSKSEPDTKPVKRLRTQRGPAPPSPKQPELNLQLTRRDSLTVPIEGAHSGTPHQAKKKREIFFRHAGLTTGFYEVIGIKGSIVRTAAALSSTVVFKLPNGARVHVVEIDGNRMRIDEPYTGWVSFQNGRGQPLLKYKFQSQHKSPRARSASPSNFSPRKRRSVSNAASKTTYSSRAGVVRSTRPALGRRKRQSPTMKFGDQSAALDALKGQNENSEPAKVPTVRRGAIFQQAEKGASTVPVAEVSEALKKKSWGELEGIIKKMIRQCPTLMEHVLQTNVGINI